MPITLRCQRIIPVGSSFYQLSRRGQLSSHLHWIIVWWSICWDNNLGYWIIIIALIIRYDVQFIPPFNCRNDKYLDVARWQRPSWVIVHFTVACLVAKPLNRSEVKGDLVMIQMLLLFKCKLLCYHANQILVSITTWSPSASLQIQGLATQYTTVKWPIATVLHYI